MVTQLEAMSLEYRLFDAVDGRKDWEILKQSVDIDAFERNVGRKVMQGEIGCYHSHLGVWQQLIQSDASAGLVLEDDVIFHKDFKQAVNAALSAIEKWDMVKLNHIRAKFPVVKADIGNWHLAAFLGAFTGTGAYLITRKAAGKLSDNLLPITRPIDHQIDRSHRQDIRHLGLTPFPSHVEDSGQSTITGKGFDGVSKFPPHKRLNTYWQRWKNLFEKSLYTMRL